MDGATGSFSLAWNYDTGLDGTWGTVTNFVVQVGYVGGGELDYTNAGTNLSQTVLIPMTAPTTNVFVTVSAQADDGSESAPSSELEYTATAQ
jgi:hypothetical protein